MAAMLPKVVVVGSTFVDMAVRCKEFPESGETVCGSGFSCSVSGAGVSQAIMAALCGCEVTLISKSGRDVFREMMLEKLGFYGVNCELLLSAEAKSTGVRMTFVDSSGGDMSCVCPGANRSLTAKDILSERVEKAIAGADVCLIHGQLPREATVQAIRMAKLHKTKVILDPVLGVLDEPGIGGFPLDYYSVDVLIPNIDEASELAASGGSGDQAAKLMACDLIERGVGCAVIKMGKRGSYVVDKEKSSHIPAFRIDIVDRSGCGDAFAGALAACCAVGDDIRKSVKFASAAGALACTKFGQVDSLPDKQSIIELLQKYPD